MKHYIAFSILVVSIVVASLILLGGGVFHSDTQNTAIIKNQIMNSRIVIDVRTDEEWSAGHVAGALHFDLARMEQGELPDIGRDVSIALYCRTGIRAGKALQILETNGFTNVSNVGGFADLQARGEKICIGEASNCGS